MFDQEIMQSFQRLVFSVIMFAEFCLQCANQGRDQGNNDNSDDNQREVLFDDRKITEEVSRPAAKRNPSNYAGKAVRQKSLVLST